MFLFFTHPDSSAAESSLSTRREGEEGESNEKITGILTDSQFFEFHSLVFNSL